MPKISIEVLRGRFSGKYALSIGNHRVVGIDDGIYSVVGHWKVELEELLAGLQLNKLAKETTRLLNCPGCGRLEAKYMLCSHCGRKFDIEVEE